MEEVDPRQVVVAVVSTTSIEVTLHRSREAAMARVASVARRHLVEVGEVGEDDLALSDDAAIYQAFDDSDEEYCWYWVGQPSES